MAAYVLGWRGDDDHATPLEHSHYPVTPGHTAADTPKLAALVECRRLPRVAAIKAAGNLRR
jgi:hypothetical protein